MAKKKQVNYLTYIPIATLSIGMIAGFVRFQVQAENTKTKVEELCKDVKENETEKAKELEEIKEDSKELEKEVEVNKNQQLNIQKEVKQVSDKTDKIIDMLMQMQKKK